MPFPSPDTRLHLSLKDGTPVLVRPLTPEDRGYLQEGIERLSLRSRLTRFFSPLGHFSEYQLDYLTHVDQEQHVAWGVVTDDDDMIGLGVGRFARLKGEPGVAEVAVTVVDEYQKRGLGSLLLALLYRSAQRLGVEHFRASVLLENDALVHHLQDLGAVMTDRKEGVIEFQLPADPDALEDSPGADQLRALLAEVDAAITAQEDAQSSQNDA